MANVDSPFGLRPVRFDAEDVNIYYVDDDSNAIFIGDPVFANGSADANGIQAVDRKGTIADGTPSNNTPIVGVVVGFASDKAGTQLRDDERYLAAGSTGYALVCDNPDVVFEIQEDSDGGALAAGAVGANYNFTTTAGSTVTGLSGVEIDSSDTSDETSAFAALRIKGLARRPDNAIGTNATWEVQIVHHQSRAGAVGV